MKFKKKESLSRDEAARRLAEIAAALSEGAEFELERGGEKLELDVPGEVTFELEVEIKDGETELEVEIKWASATARAEPTELQSSASAT